MVEVARMFRFIADRSYFRSADRSDSNCSESDGAGWMEFTRFCSEPFAGPGTLRGRGLNPCSVCGARQKSINDVWWTQLTVQFGAQYFSVRNSCFTSSVVYSASGTPGKPRCCEQ